MRSHKTRENHFLVVKTKRCRVHFMRNLLAHIPKADKAMVAAAVRTIFAQPNREAAGQQLRYVAETAAPPLAQERPNCC